MPQGASVAQQRARLHVRLGTGSGSHNGAAATATIGEPTVSAGSLVDTAAAVCRVCSLPGHQAGFVGAIYYDCPNFNCYLCKAAGHTTQTCPWRILPRGAASSETELPPAESGASRLQLLRDRELTAVRGHRHSEAWRGSASVAAALLRSGSAATVIAGHDRGCSAAVHASALSGSTGRSSCGARSSAYTGSHWRVGAACYKLHTRRVTTLGFHPVRPDVLVSTDKSGEIGVWRFLVDDASLGGRGGGHSGRVGTTGAAGGFAPEFGFPAFASASNAAGSSTTAAGGRQLQQRHVYAGHRWLINAWDWYAAPSLGGRITSGSPLVIVTASSDGSVRLQDLERQTWEELVDANPGGWTGDESRWRMFYAVSAGSGCSTSAAACGYTGPIYAGDDVGRIWAIDPRSHRRVVAVFQGHKKGCKVQSLQHHPTAPDILVSAGNDWLAKIWDLRLVRDASASAASGGSAALRAASPAAMSMLPGGGGGDMVGAAAGAAAFSRPLEPKAAASAALADGLGAASPLVSLPHGRVITNALFSPLTGSRLLTTCADNRLRVWNDVKSLISLATDIDCNGASGGVGGGASGGGGGGFGLPGVYGDAGEDASTAMEDGGSTPDGGGGSDARAARSAYAFDSAAGSASADAAPPAPAARGGKGSGRGSRKLAAAGGGRRGAAAAASDDTDASATAGVPPHLLPDVAIVHSHDFARYLTVFRAAWDPKDPAEETIVCGRYISEAFSRTRLRAAAQGWGVGGHAMVSGCGALADQSHLDPFAASASGGQGGGRGAGGGAGSADMVALHPIDVFHVPAASSRANAQSGGRFLSVRYARTTGLGSDADGAAAAAAGDGDAEPVPDGIGSARGSAGGAGDGCTGTRAGQPYRVVAQLLDPLADMITPVVAVHPTLHLLATGSSRNVYLWTPSPAFQHAADTCARLAGSLPRRDLRSFQRGGGGAGGEVAPEALVRRVFSSANRALQTGVAACALTAQQLQAAEEQPAPSGRGRQHYGSEARPGAGDVSDGDARFRASGGLLAAVDEASDDGDDDDDDAGGGTGGAVSSVRAAALRGSNAGTSGPVAVVLPPPPPPAPAVHSFVVTGPAGGALAGVRLTCEGRVAEMAGAGAAAEEADGEPQSPPARAGRRASGSGRPRSSAGASAAAAAAAAATGGGSGDSGSSDDSGSSGEDEAAGPDGREAGGGAASEGRRSGAAASRGGRGSGRGGARGRGRGKASPLHALPSPSAPTFTASSGSGASLGTSAGSASAVLGGAGGGGGSSGSGKASGKPSSDRGGGGRGKAAALAAGIGTHAALAAGEGKDGAAGGGLASASCASSGAAGTGAAAFVGPGVPAASDSAPDLPAASEPSELRGSGRGRGAGRGRGRGRAAAAVAGSHSQAGSLAPAAAPALGVMGRSDRLLTVDAGIAEGETRSLAATATAMAAPPLASPQRSRGSAAVDPPIGAAASSPPLSTAVALPQTGTGADGGQPGVDANIFASFRRVPDAATDDRRSASGAAAAPPAGGSAARRSPYFVPTAGGSMGRAALDGATAGAALAERRASTAGPAAPGLASEAVPDEAGGLSGRKRGREVPTSVERPVARRSAAAGWADAVEAEPSEQGPDVAAAAAPAAQPSPARRLSSYFHGAAAASSSVDGEAGAALGQRSHALATSPALGSAALRGSAAVPRLSRARGGLLAPQGAAQGAASLVTRVPGVRSATRQLGAAAATPIAHLDDYAWTSGGDFPAAQPPTTTAAGSFVELARAGVVEALLPAAGGGASLLGAVPQPSRNAGAAGAAAAQEPRAGAAAVKPRVRRFGGDDDDE